ncbi:tubulin-specific chaperone C [Heteronotia binoei]|uniref:tubulin-specific chaperone C n=1 Tax=Heteronotia binoei TaxID=13085 RepID=UPI00292E4ED4|nr:tubulin-specific chaperone C [Heteronotia binoei]XP_060103405.1 tubulin-specific chaperone C [Heteronotia binoei]
MEAVSEAAAEGERLSIAAGVPPSVPERLQQREAERREEAGRRRRERDAQAVQEEQSDFFTAAFVRERDAVEALLGPELDTAAEAAATRLEEAAGRLQSLKRLLTDSVRFLAPYEVRQAQATLTKLQNTLSERRLQVQPKKRFAFRARKKESAAAQEPPKDSTRAQASSEAVLSSSDPECGFSRVEGQELQLGPAELLQRNVVLSHLTSCRVQLCGNPNTLLMRGCRDCTVLCGPVSTSALVEDCSGCLLALPCQQLRAHHTTQTSFYVQVTSRAMLEDCSGVRLAPYTWSYVGIEADFETSGLDRSRDNWSQVDDFNWLARDQPSPNWSVIPEEERVCDWS